MAEIPRIRCPVCGHLIFLRNVMAGVRHKVEVFVHHIHRKLKGKGFDNVYTRQPLPDGLLDFWIRRLEEVILYLKELKKLEKRPSLSLQPQDQPVLRSQVSPVSVRFVSPQTALSSESLKTPTLSVQGELQKTSLEETPKLHMKSVQKPLLRVKTNM